LFELHEQGKNVVFIIDEAQALSDEGLETLRLLTNFETESKKLMQVVLFGQPELDLRIKQPRLRQLLQRITFSCQLGSIDREFMRRYICHRLISAGHAHGDLFNDQAINDLYRYSRGIPRLINILCHKSLLLAYSKNQGVVDRGIVKQTVTASMDNLASHTGNLSPDRKVGFGSVKILSICVWTLSIAAVAYSAYLYLHIR